MSASGSLEAQSYRALEWRHGVARQVRLPPRPCPPHSPTKAMQWHRRAQVGPTYLNRSHRISSLYRTSSGEPPPDRTLCWIRVDTSGSEARALAAVHRDRREPGRPVSSCRFGPSRQQREPADNCRAAWRMARTTWWDVGTNDSSFGCHCLGCMTMDDTHERCVTVQCVQHACLHPRHWTKRRQAEESVHEQCHEMRCYRCEIACDCVSVARAVTHKR